MKLAKVHDVDSRGVVLFMRDTRAVPRIARLVDPRNRRDLFARVKRHRGIIAFASALAVWLVAFALMVRAF
jgi:hypothetical protein